MNQTAWLLISTTLLLLTLPGVALFYGGMVRKKNVLNTMGLPLLALALASLEWVLLSGALPLNSRLWGTVPQSGEGGTPLLAYHAIACALALALLAGAVVERVRLR